jgi:hypothetical protein
MNEAQAVEAIYQRFASAWPSRQPLVPFVFENEQAEAQSEWARVSVRHGSAGQVTMGRAPYRKFDRRGTVMVQLFAPVNTGRARLSEMADSVREVLEGVSLGELHMHEARTEETPTDGAWAMCSVVVRFRYTSTR